MNMDNEVLQVNIDDIIPNRFQPRLSFDEQGLQELAASIKEHGIIQPLVLRKLGNKYEIIAGERRYKASQMAGLTTVPAVISNIDDNKSAEVALVENIQRRDLTPIEEARSYKSLLDKGYLTQEQLAKKMGLSQSAISNKLRLLNLDDSVQQALLEERISERHARALLALPNKEDQKKFLEKTITERLTVRALDKEIKHFLSGNDADIPKVDLTPNIESIKNNATDLNQKRMSVDSMMVPDSVMTDYSNPLPPKEEPSVEPTPKIEIPNSLNMETESSPKIEVPNSLNVETEPKVDLGLPVFNNPAPEPTGEPTRFFNDLPTTQETPKDDYDINSLFQLGTDPNFNAGTLHVIDNPMTPKEEPKPEEKPPVEEPLNNSYLGPQTNRFFNSAATDPVIPTPPIDETPKIFDPMALVEEEKPAIEPVVNPTVPVDNEKSIIDNAINSLKQSGLNVELNETDTLNSTIYTIIIRK